jgi:hypothetical protein
MEEGGQVIYLKVQKDLSAKKLMREAIKNKESIKITLLNYNKTKKNIGLN